MAQSYAQMARIMRECTAPGCCNEPEVPEDLEQDEQDDPADDDAPVAQG